MLEVIEGNRFSEERFVSNFFRNEGLSLIPKTFLEKIDYIIDDEDLSLRREVWIVLESLPENKPFTKKCLHSVVDDPLSW